MTSRREHGPNCQWEKTEIPCREFSTDGTHLGAKIAHTFGTTDEEEIAGMSGNLCVIESDIAVEQTDWESDE